MRIKYFNKDTKTIEVVSIASACIGDCNCLYLFGTYEHEAAAVYYTDDLAVPAQSLLDTLFEQGYVDLTDIDVTQSYINKKDE